MNDLVSVTIPTRNSARTIASALQSVADQTYRELETIVIDGDSSDGTREIATRYGVRVELCRRPLLAARVQGIEEARGRFILLLDSDQVLEPTAIERSVRMMSDFDMLSLWEEPISTRTFTEGLHQASRIVVQSNAARYLNPYSGIFLPRFYRAEVLKKAVESIPPDALDFVSDRDHQIIFYEAWKRSRSVGIVGNAVLHHDPSNLYEVVTKSFRWGYGAGILRASHRYDELLRRRYAPRIASPLKERPQSVAMLVLKANFLALLKGIPYEMGMMIGQWKWKLTHH